jgi:hypothetical protein
VHSGFEYPDAREIHLKESHTSQLSSDVQKDSSLFFYDVTISCFRKKDHSLTDWIGRRGSHLGLRGKKLQEAEENCLLISTEILCASPSIIRAINKKICDWLYMLHAWKRREMECKKT